MHDIRFIREQPTEFDKALERRGLDAWSKPILERDAERRAVQTALQEAQAKRNELSKQIGSIKAKGGDASEIMQKVAILKDEIAALEQKDKESAEAINQILSSLPNLPAAD